MSEAQKVRWVEVHARMSCADKWGTKWLAALGERSRHGPSASVVTGLRGHGVTYWEPSGGTVGNVCK